MYTYFFCNEVVITTVFWTKDWVTAFPEENYVYNHRVFIFLGCDSPT